MEDIQKAILNYNKNIDKENKSEKKKGILLKRLIDKLKIDGKFKYFLDGEVSKWYKIKKKELDEEDIRLLLEKDYTSKTGETIPNLFTELHVSLPPIEDVAHISFDDNIKPSLHFSFNFELPSSHIEMRKDKGFEEKIRKTKEMLLEKQKICPICKGFFDKNKRDKIPTLHHTKTKEKQENFSKIVDRLKKEFLSGKKTFSDIYNTISTAKEEYVIYYKSLKDTELICFDCHSKKEHPKYIITSIYNKYSRKINEAKENNDLVLIKKLREDYYEMERHDLFNDENNKWIERLSNGL